MSALSALGTRCCRPITRRFAFWLPLSHGISATGCDGDWRPILIEPSVSRKPMRRPGMSRPEKRRSERQTATAPCADVTKQLRCRACYFTLFGNIPIHCHTHETSKYPIMPAAIISHQIRYAGRSRNGTSPKRVSDRGPATHAVESHDWTHCCHAARPIAVSDRSQQALWRRAAAHRQFCLRIDLLPCFTSGP